MNDASIVRAIQRAPVHRPPASLLNRVRESRAQGTTVALSSEPSPRARSSSALSLLVAAAAASMLLLLPSPRGESPELPQPAGAFAWGPMLAYAQAGGTDYTRLDPARVTSLAPGVWRYALVKPGIAAVRVLPLEERISLRDDRTIEVTHTYSSGTRESTDTIWLQRLTLSPLRRVSAAGILSTETMVSGDRLRRAYPLRPVGEPIRRGQAESAIPEAFVNAPFLIDSDHLIGRRMLPTLFRALPIRGPGTLQLAWVTGKVESLSEMTTSSGTLPIRVVGQEVISVPAGKFTAWRLEVRWPDRKGGRTWWLATGSQVLIRDRLTSDNRLLWDQQLVSGPVQ